MLLQTKVVLHQYYISSLHSKFCLLIPNTFYGRIELTDMLHKSKAFGIRSIWRAGEHLTPSTIIIKKKNGSQRNQGLLIKPQDIYIPLTLIVIKYNLVSTWARWKVSDTLWRAFIRVMGFRRIHRRNSHWGDIDSPFITFQISELHVVACLWYNLPVAAVLMWSVQGRFNIPNVSSWERRTRAAPSCSIKEPITEPEGRRIDLLRWYKSIDTFWFFFLIVRLCPTATSRKPARSINRQIRYRDRPSPVCSFAWMIDSVTWGESQRRTRYLQRFPSLSKAPLSHIGFQ